ncbi:MAG TPA: magnesium transporter [Candidatus Latescibacteria bacterium]|nr:magnesium transporter [Candidatus Latescibacterota bacterium]
MEEEGLRKILNNLRRYIKQDQRFLLRDLLHTFHPADVASVLSHMNDEEVEYLFGLLEPEVASEVLREMDEDVREHLLGSLGSERLSEVVGRMESDDAADIISKLPEDKAERVLEDMSPQASKEVRELLQHREDTAGRLMAVEVVAVNQDDTVDRAIAAIRKAVDEMGECYYVYVVDDEGRLVGVLPLTKLLVSRSDRKVSEIMKRDVVSVPEDMDQEEVAQLFRRYDLVAVPVVDGDGKLIGRITVDDVMEVVEEETSEDIGRMAGTDETIREEAAWKISWARFPWILTSLLSGFISGSIISTFQGTIGRFLPLAAFIPIITAMGGNIGLQSASITVRGLALGKIDTFEIWKRVLREARVGIMMGVFCGGTVGLVATLWHRNPAFGLVVGVAMWCAILVAAIMGTVVPMIFRKFKVDPAIAAGPFITMSNDITGLAIYLSIATAMLKWLVG